MNTSSTVPTVQLAPPGAGLPTVERFVANMMLHWQASRVTRAQAVDAFAGERDVILQLVRATSTERLAMPTLIRRLRGLEDSSRNWSVFMALDHLCIVNRQLAGVISTLAAGSLPPGVASTAAVKPRAEVDESVIQAFETTCAEFEDSVAAQTDLKTKQRFAHPWFGPLDAAKWHFMAGFHMRLHRRQIQTILAQAE